MILGNGNGKEMGSMLPETVAMSSLRPEALQIFLDFYLKIMHGRSSLSRVERELIATVTSQINGCFY